MNTLIQTIGIAGTLTEAVLYFLVASRASTRKKFPAFTVYVGILACSDLLLWYVQSELGAAEYFWCWWAQYAVLSVAKVAVVLEIFRNLFSPFWIIPKGPLYMLLAALLVSGIIALLYAIHSPSTYVSSYLKFLRTAGRTIDLLVSVTMWFVVLFARYFGMPWRKKCSGIAIGLCVELTAAGVISVIRASSNHRIVHDLLAPIGMLTWLIALAIWISYFARGDKEVVMRSEPEQIELIRLTTTAFRNSLDHALLGLS